MNNTPEKRNEKSGVSGEAGRIILTPDELLEIFPEPEECLPEIERALSEGLTIVKNQEHQKKLTRAPELPELAEAESVQESIQWYLNQIGQFSRLSDAEEKELARKTMLGDQTAREKMINANLRLVVSQAKKFKHRGLAFMDLIQAGNMGLIKAVEKFHPDKQLRLGIFAIPFIKEAIWKAVRRQGYLMKMPREQAEKIKIVHETRLNLIQEKGRWPTATEVASICGLDSDEVERIYKLDQILVSLDKQMDESGRRMIDQLKSEAESDEFRLADREDINLDGLLEHLPQQSREIIILHYGLKGAHLRTAVEIAKLLGIQVDEIYRIENAAFEKLKELLDEKEF